MTNKHTKSVEEIVEWKDGMIVEFMAYEMHTNEGGSETWDNYLSVFQRGVVLGDEVVGCDYELSKEDFVKGVYKDGVDEDGSYNVEEYLEAVMVEPDWLQVERQKCDEIVKAEYENGVKQTIAHLLRMNLENPKAPVNIDELKRRALSERLLSIYSLI